MQGIISTENKPIKLWLNDADEGTLEQALNLANHPCTFSHVALMPDSHTGYGMPIGGVLATQNAIIPNAVGVDIGCGMCSLQTSLTEISRKKLAAILGDIKSLIPRGHKWHKHPQGDWLNQKEKSQLHNTIIEREYEHSCEQLGTLGSGNHFIEIQKGSDGHIWIMIHSGSRNLGKTVAEHYNHLAIDLNKKYKLGIPKRWQLDYLPLNSREADIYLREMQNCVKFAYHNRKQMMKWVEEVFRYHFGGPRYITFSNFINIPHNYAAFEKHYGVDVWVHRKGATQAKSGQLGIIPGSQGTKSYIVEGLGNPESFESCSHGAGRKMGRREAKRSLDLKTEIEYMNEKGILHEITSTRDLDEAASAYKDIDIVMENQIDLVKTIIELHPLGVIKG
ncbi:MAG: RtcB family protein [Marinifilaceae bacterium]